MQSRAFKVGAFLLGGLAAAALIWWARRREPAGEGAPVEPVTVPDSIRRRPEPSGAVAVLGGVLMDAAAVVGLAEPRGIRNRNPGNIRWIPREAARWRGMLADDGSGYAIFDTVENGVRAIGKELLLDERRGVNTVRGLIGAWAPPTENDTGAYVESVARALGVAPDAPLSVSARLPELVAAIIRHENGKQPYALAELAAWARLP